MSQFGYYTYVLYSKILDKFYIGYSQNLRKRLVGHKRGNVTTTSKMPDWKLTYYEVCSSKQDAIIREKQLKTGFGRAYLRRRLRHCLATI